MPPRPSRTLLILLLLAAAMPPPRVTNCLIVASSGASLPGTGKEVRSRARNRIGPVDPPDSPQIKAIPAGGDRRPGRPAGAGFPRPVRAAGTARVVPPSPGSPAIVHLRC